MAKKSRRKKSPQARIPVVIRAFEGLPSEGDWVAMREFVPSASAVITLKDGQQVRLASLLPGAGAGMVRQDGEILVGLQVMHNHGDISRDLAHVIELARTTEPGNPIKMTTPQIGDRLQDMIAEDSGFEIEIHPDFSWWLSPEDRESPAAVAALEQANASASPTTRLDAVDSAWVTEMGDHTYLRWVMTNEPEDDLVDGFARLKAAGSEAISEGTRLIGMFRAHGVLVPVWELDEATIDEVESAAPAFVTRLAEALAEAASLTGSERSVRQELISRQVTIR